MIELILVIIVIELGIIIRNTLSKESWLYLFFQTSFHIAICYALIFFRAFLFALIFALIFTLSNHSHISSYFSFLCDFKRFNELSFQIWPFILFWYYLSKYASFYKKKPSRFTTGGKNKYMSYQIITKLILIRLQTIGKIKWLLNQLSGQLLNQL